MARNVLFLNAILVGCGLFVAPVVTAQSSAVQAPAAQAPATQAPATQAPATQAPATQAPATQAPATQAPAAPTAQSAWGEKSPIVYQWHSGYSGHNRLLFEEPKLERQGISRVPPVQLARSSTAFFSRSLLLPLNFALGRHRQPESRQ